MSFIAPTPEFTALPELFCEQTCIISETMATTMKVTPIGIVLHHTNAFGFQPGLEVAGWTDPGDFASTDILGERESLEGYCSKASTRQSEGSERALTAFVGQDASESLLVGGMPGVLR
jgi:hypothetical protein